MPDGSKLPPIGGNATKMFPHFVRSGLASMSLQSSVLVPVVVGATYFSAAIVVVVVAAVEGVLTRHLVFFTRLNANVTDALSC